MKDRPPVDQGTCGPLDGQHHGSRPSSLSPLSARLRAGGVRALGERAPEPVPLADRLPRREVAELPAWLSRPVVERPPARPRPSTIPPRSIAADLLAAARVESEREAARVAAVEIDAVVSSYLDGIARLVAALRSAGRRSSTEIVDLALMVTRELLGREARTDRDFVIDAVEHALHAVGGGPGVSVRLPARDLAVLRERRPDLLGGETVFVADESLAAGGCVVETTERVVDASIDGRIAEIRAALIEILDQAAAPTPDDPNLEVTQC